MRFKGVKIEMATRSELHNPLTFVFVDGMKDQILLVVRELKNVRRFVILVAGLGQELRQDMLIPPFMRRPE